jgi:hypothetical protein
VLGHAYLAEPAIERGVRLLAEAAYYSPSARQTRKTLRAAPRGEYE